jgi:hypothetical protein
MWTGCSGKCCWVRVAECYGLLSVPLRLQDAVAAFEAKYNRLKTRYRELTEAHREEVDGLHDEIAGLQERLVDLEAAAAQLEVARCAQQRLLAGGNVHVVL